VHEAVFGGDWKWVHEALGVGVESFEAGHAGIRIYRVGDIWQL